MMQADEQIKKYSEEYSQIRQKIAAKTKKEGGSLTGRDYTDDIYNKPVDGSLFVESANSQVFCNLLLVLHQTTVD